MRKKFNELTRREQKMKIVKDAIFQINKGLITPSEGKYFEFKKISTYEQLGEENSLQVLLKRGNKCVACAKGSLFASCVINVNKVGRSYDVDEEEFQKEKLKKWFSALELDMIETAFEGRVVTDSKGRLEEGGNAWTFADVTQLGQKCISFGEQYKSVKNRLLVILENIKKFGKFTP